MKCSLKECGKTIPVTRKRSAKYCSDECYYIAKKERSITRYAQLRQPATEFKRCEGILAYLYGIALLKKPIEPADLQSLNFNFAISSGEHLDNQKRLFKVIGKYAYHIDINKNLIIWKSK